MRQFYWEAVIRSGPRERRTAERHAQLEHIIREALRTGQFEHERAEENCGNSENILKRWSQSA